MDDTGSQEHASFPMELWAKADLISPMAIRVAATLGVADHIDAGIRTAEGIARVTSTDPDAMGRLLAHLVTTGILERSTEDTYALTGLGVQLTSTHPSSGRAWLDINGALGRTDLAIVDLAETVRTGEPAYPRVYGRGFWEDLAANPTLSASFDKLMSAHSFDGVVAAFDWASAGHVVDVGGGDGALLARILDAHPHLEGTVVELAGPAASAAQRFAAGGLSDRASVVEASFFDPLPAVGDCYVLSGVIHDWDDPEATTILSRCADAAGANGVVIMLEGLRPADSQYDDGRGSREMISTHMDLRMLTCAGGRERTREQLASIAAEAGLAIESVNPATEYSSLVVAKSTGSGGSS